MQIKVLAATAAWIVGMAVVPTSSVGARSIPDLRASVTLATGGTHVARWDMSALGPRDFDIVRRRRASVTLGYPAQRRRSQRDPYSRRCALITYTLRAREGRTTDPLARARELLPVAELEGVVSADRDLRDDRGDGMQPQHAWRLFGDIVDDDRLLAYRGVAVRASGGPESFEGGPPITRELSLTGRMTRSDGRCGGTNRFTLGPRVLLPLYR